MLAWLSIIGYPLTILSQSSVFTYQGHLSDAGSPATGLYDLEFNLFSAPEGGSALTAPALADDVPVTNGLFTVNLDFSAGVFDGSDRWLDTAVRPGASTGDYTNVVPRQKITATPYAIRAANFSGPVAASQITGTLASSNIGFGTITSSNLAPGAAAASLQAGGQVGVPGGGMILSSNYSDGNLANAGYVKLGKVDLGDVWEQRVGGTPPTQRYRHTAVWTGSEMIVWGGENNSGWMNNGGCYNPAAKANSACRSERTTILGQNYETNNHGHIC